MKKIIIALVILAGVGIGTYYIVFRNGSNNVPASNTSVPIAPEASSVASVQTVSVAIQNFAFNPVAVTINKGDTVKWTNMDSATHRIKADAFNSNNLSQGQSFEFKFDNSGAYNYICGIHPFMNGRIIVK